MSQFSEWWNHTSEKNATMRAAKEQIDFYKNEKEALNKQREEADAEKSLARQKINEKQLRSRKATYRRAGFLEAPNTAPADKLG